MLLLSVLIPVVKRKATIIMKNENLTKNIQEEKVARKMVPEKRETERNSIPKVLKHVLSNSTQSIGVLPISMTERCRQKLIPLGETVVKV